MDIKLTTITVSLFRNLKTKIIETNTVLLRVKVEHTNTQIPTYKFTQTQTNIHKHNTLTQTCTCTHTHSYMITIQLNLIQHSLIKVSLWWFPAQCRKLIVD